MRVADRDTIAFKIIYQAYAEKVYRIANRLLHREVLAEEAVQEIFLKLWLQEEKLRDIQSLDAYLRVLTRRHCLNVIRRLLLETEAESLLTQDAKVADNTTEDTILLNDARGLLAATVAGLPEQQRTAYSLCHEEGLSYEEAAARMGITHNTLKTHMKRALSTIRKQLDAGGGMTAILIILRII